MDWLRRMIIGRNDPDKLSNYTLGIGFVCSIISSVFRIRFLNILATILLLIALFRVLSKNVYAGKHNVPTVTL